MTKIVIVEDQGIVALSLERMLEELGYEVPYVAVSGEEAVEQVTKVQPDLVLMDIMLAGELDGIEAATQIQAQIDIPIIYLTAHSDETTLQRAKITGPFGYLIKPFDKRDLYITVDMALYKHQMEQKLKERTLELEQALAQIKTLGGLLPICASCKSIRNDEGYWQQVEIYLMEHSDAEFSHGICPDCKAKLYPEF